MKLGNIFLVVNNMANCQVPSRTNFNNALHVCTPIDLYVNVNKMLISIFCWIRVFFTWDRLVK